MMWSPIFARNAWASIFKGKLLIWWGYKSYVSDYSSGIISLRIKCVIWFHYLIVERYICGVLICVIAVRFYAEPLSDLKRLVIRKIPRPNKITWCPLSTFKKGQTQDGLKRFTTVSIVYSSACVVLWCKRVVIGFRGYIMAAGSIGCLALIWRERFVNRITWMPSSKS